MKKVNPPISLTSTLFEKLRGKSKNKLDLKKTSGFELFEKNVKNNLNAMSKKSAENNTKITDEYDSYKSNSKLNNLSREIINKYTSEKDFRNSSHSLYRVVSNPSDLILNNQLVNDKSNILSSRTNIKQNLSSNHSVNNLNHLPNSPSDSKVIGSYLKQSSNYTKFANNTKHKKGSKSVSYHFNISSINMLKHKPGNQTNLPTSSNLSYEKEEKKITKKSNNMKGLNQKRNNLSNEILGVLGMSNGKGMCKLSAESSTKSSVVLLQKTKTNEVDCPEELHYLYVKMFKNNKSLAYKFENEDFDEKLKSGSIEF